jgi:hypothetical protein
MGASKEKRMKQNAREYKEGISRSVWKAVNWDVGGGRR